MTSAAIRNLAGLSLIIYSLTGSAEAAETVNHQYDELGRLVSSTKTGGPATGTQTSTSYDPAGNRSNQTTTGAPGGPPPPPPPPAPSFAVANAPTVNGGSPLVFSITKSGSTSSTYTVNYATANGTAVAGTDYTATSGTLSFAPGDVTKTVSVATLGSAPAGTRTVLMTISGVSGGATISTPQASGSVNYAGGTTTIVLTDSSLIVLPAHASAYYCTTSGAPSQTCILTSNGATVFSSYQGNTTTLLTGYSINGNTLEVLSSYYGTAQ